MLRSLDLHQSVMNGPSEAELALQHHCFLLFASSQTRDLRTEQSKSLKQSNALRIQFPGYRLSNYFRSKSFSYWIGFLDLGSSEVEVSCTLQL